MWTATLAFVLGTMMALASLPTTQAHAAPVVVPQVSQSTIQPVWYDRWGRWHPPYYYGYGIRPPGYYAYGPRRLLCVRTSPSLQVRVAAAERVLPLRLLLICNLAPG